MELAIWDRGTHCCPQPWLEASSSHCLIQAQTIPKVPPPWHCCCSPHQELTTEGSLSPDHPAGRSRWGGTSWEAAPGLLRPPSPRGPSDAVCQRGLGLEWECRWAWKHGLGNADAGDGAVTAMPTHPLPPGSYFWVPAL